MAVSKPHRYGRGAFACRVEVPKGLWWVLVGFDAWPKSATWQFRTGIDMAFVPLLVVFMPG